MNLLAPETIDLSSLPSMAFPHFERLPKVTAIYFVIAPPDEICYIGRAINLNRRWKAHHKALQYAIVPNMRLAWLIIEDQTSLPDLEKCFITYYKPCDNRPIRDDPPQEETSVLPVFPKTIGGRVQQRRMSLRLSQDELAKRAGITQGLLSRIEHGKTLNPGADVLKGLARALGCSIDYLVDLYDEEYPLHALMASTAS